MDYVNLSASMTMLELVRFLSQGSNNSFSFYSGNLGNFNCFKENSESNKTITSICQYICKKVREVWTVDNIGVIAVNNGELMICVTSPDPSVPAETVSFIVEAMGACLEISPGKSAMAEFSEGRLEIMDEDVTPDLIQVNASMKEINDRIEQFIRYKREQANANNVLDFCGASDDRQFCARVDAVLVRKKDSSSHMAVRNVLDRYTAKHNMKKSDNAEKLTNVSTSHESSNMPSQNWPLVTHQSDTTNLKGEKRTFDIASLESMLNNVKKQQKI